MSRLKCVLPTVAAAVSLAGWAEDPPDLPAHANARMKRAGRHLLQIFCHALNSAGVTR